MNGSLPRPASPWRRSRYWATAACCTAALAGLLTLIGGHHLHGGLMLVAALLLVKKSVFARGYRRQALEAALPSHPEAVSPARKWRKAA